LGVKIYGKNGFHQLSEEPKGIFFPWDVFVETSHHKVHTLAIADDRVTLGISHHNALDIAHGFRNVEGRSHTILL
jgi:hypothetical protein